MCVIIWPRKRLSYTNLHDQTGWVISSRLIWLLIIPVVATYPSAGGRHGAHGCVSHGRKVHGVATNVIREKRRKNRKRCGLRTLSVKGSGVVFTHREGISTPRVRHKGRQPLTKCAISCLRFVLFSLFYVFMSFYDFLYFLSFCGRQGCFPRSYVSSIAMRKSDLRSSLRTEHWLSCFYLFLQDIFWPNKCRLRHWTTKRCFDFWKGEKR